MRAARLTRCVRLLNTFQSRIGHTIEDLARAFEVSERTVYRDLRLLADAGVPTSHNAEKRGRTLEHNILIRTSRLSNDELTSLLLAAHIVSLSYSADVGHPIHQAVGKVLAQAPATLREDLAGLLNSISGKPTAALWPLGPQSAMTEILAAIRQKRPIRIVYRPAQQSASAIHTKITSPRLVAAGLHWYLIGRSSWHRKVFRFDLRHVHSVQQIDESPSDLSGPGQEEHCDSSGENLQETGPKRWAFHAPVHKKMTAGATIESPPCLGQKTGPAVTLFLP
jgi:predicted DNA-binding transcriptional regulator YafY